MTGIAVHGRVSSGQREAIVVLLDLLDSDRPSSNAMALLTIGTQLPLVNISVAVLAALAYVSEDEFDVALRAGHCLVHAAKRVAGLIVVEFRDRSDRLPRARGVAVLAGQVQAAVWTMRAPIALRLRLPGA